MSTLGRFDDLRGNTVHEADVSAECAPTKENSRLPRADENQGRAEGAQASAREGAETPDRLTGRFPRRERLTTGSDFQALFQRGKRVDRPSMTILWCESVDARRRSRTRGWSWTDRKSTRLNSSHVRISYAVFCLKRQR